MKEIAEKSVSSFFGGILGNFLSFVILLLVTNSLGKSVYGEVVYFLAFFSTVEIFVQFGMGNVLVSFLSRSNISQEFKRSIVASAVGLVAMLSLSVMGICLFFRRDILTCVLKSSNEGLFLMLLPVIMMSAVTNLLLEALRSQKQISKNVIIFSLLMPMTRLVSIALLVYGIGWNDYYAIVIPHFLSYIVGLTCCCYCLCSMGIIGKYNYSYPRGELVKFAIPVLFTSFISVVMTNTDKYMIGFMIGPDDVAVYNVAIAIGGVTGLGLTAINSIFAPVISNLYSKNDMEQLGKTYAKATKWAVIINLLIVGVVTLISEEIMYIAGKDYVSGGVVLVLVCVGYVVDSAVGSVGYMNVMTGHPEYNMYANIVAVIVNIIGNYYLVPILGMYGAAFMTAVALGMHNLCNFWLMYKKLQLHPFSKRYLYTISSFVVAYIVGLGIRAICVDFEFMLREMIEIVAYVFLFATMVYKMAMDQDEKMLLGKLVGRLH